MSPNTPPPSSERWTAFERTFFAILTVTLAVFVVWMDGRPTAVFFGALVLLLVVFGVELRKVELPPGLTITFADDRTGDDGDGGRASRDDDRTARDDGR